MKNNEIFNGLSIDEKIDIWTTYKEISKKRYNLTDEESEQWADEFMKFYEKDTKLK